MRILVIFLIFSSIGMEAKADPLPCLSRSLFANGTAYNIINANGDLVANMTAESSSDLAIEFQELVASGQCLKNPISCARVEGPYSISNQGFQRVFNVIDPNNQVLAVITAANDREAAARFAELVAAGVCAGH